MKKLWIILLLLIPSLCFGADPAVKTVGGVADSAIKSIDGSLTAAIKTVSGVGYNDGDTTFLPSDIAGLIGWFEAESATCGGACSDTNTITEWSDKHTSNNDLLVSCSVSDPTYRTNRINGKAAIFFAHASEQCLSFTSAIAFGTGMTVFAVVNVSGQGGPIVSGGANSFRWWTDKSDKEQGADKADAVELGQGTAAHDTSYHQINVTYEGTHVYFRLGRAADGDAASTQTISADITGVSGQGGGWFGGDIAAIIIYNSVLSGADITKVENYLNGLYGL